MSIDPNLGYSSRLLSNYSADSKAYTWSGRIGYVDTETMVCRVFTDTGSEQFVDVPLTAPGGAGPRSWSGVIPEVGTKVLLGWRSTSLRSYQPVIMDYCTPGVYVSRDFQSFSTVDPEQAKLAIEEHPELDYDEEFLINPKRLKMRKVYSGEYLTSSALGSDILLDEDVLITNRSGVELRFRDSDLTSVLNTVNESTSNAAGFYSRGLIKRNAFSFLPDVYGENLVYSSVPQNLTIQDEYKFAVPSTSPAYPILLSYGLINSDGFKTFDENQHHGYFAPVTTNNGQRISYISSSDPTQDLTDAIQAYVEDRKELRHVSDGILAVTEETDGFFIDANTEVFIEDVHGTVVGNDFASTEGRSLYKRILRLNVLDIDKFNNFGDQKVTLSQKTPIKPLLRPVFEPIDEYSERALFNTEALARLYRIRSPSNPNKQFVFGVTKEGKVLAHIPKNTQNQSMDLNLEGLLRASIGSDPSSNLSADIHAAGGVRINAGKGPGGHSLIFNCEGDIEYNFGVKSSGENVAHKTRISGSSLTTATGVSTNVSKAGHQHLTGGQHYLEAESHSFNTGTGGHTVSTTGSHTVTAAMGGDHKYGKLLTTTFAAGQTVSVVAGVDSKTVLSGSVTRTVVAGTGLVDSVTTGDFSQNVGTGNFRTVVGAGSLSTSVAGGPITLTASAGTMAFNASAAISMNSAAAAAIGAPITTIGLVPKGFAVVGVVGPGTPALDYITGLPLLGTPTVAI